MLELFKITIAVSIMIAPVVAVCFNKFSIMSLFISSIIGIVVAPIFIICFIYLIIKSLGMFQLFYQIEPIIKIILSSIVKILLNISHFGAEIPFSKIYVTTPNLLNIIMYYLIVFSIIFLISINKKKFNQTFRKRIKNLISLLKYEYSQNKNKVISTVLIIVIIFSIIKIYPKKLKIYFIDVGQGDSTLIVTPANKSILIDGGGSKSEEYNVGKSVLFPYLLDRGIGSIDYVIISHFDTDHIDGLLYVMKEIKVKNVIVSLKGQKESENYEKFLDITKKRKINTIAVKAGDRVKIEKDIFIEILWPDKENTITENAINNYSIVCKLNYRSFCMLFTGDIEEIAERAIITKYGDSNLLKATVLKVAHHGSISSSIQEFLELVKPKIALIGVGANNKYGHPNEDVVNRLENKRCKNI